MVEINYTPLQGLAYPQGINVHTLGRTSDACYAIKQSGIYGFDRDHYSFCQPRRYHYDRVQSDAFYIAQVESMLPPVRVLRPIWNLYSFDDDGNFASSDADFWLECASRGWKFVFALFDGTTQRYYKTGRDLDEQMVAWELRHSYAWTKFLAFLDANPTIKSAVYGFEPFNEPNGYNQVENDERYSFNDAVYRLIEAEKKIIDLFVADYPDAKIYQPGWRYNASAGPYNALKIPEYGGLTAMEHLRAQYPSSEFISSIHGDGTAVTPLDYGKIYSAADLASENDKITYFEHVALTEVGGYRNNAVNMVPITENDQFQYQKNLDENHFYGKTLMWWPASDVAKARLFDLGETEVLNVYHHVLGAATAMYCYPQRADWFSGPQQGLKDASSPDAINLTPTNQIVTAYVETTFAEGVDRPATQAFSRLFGGNGTCVVDASPGQFNALYGGDGWNVLRGTDSSSDIFYTGRGGGVVRTGDLFNVVHTRWGECRVYTGPGANIVSCFTAHTNFPEINALNHETTVIIDPAGTHYVHDWHMANHKISFMGAFVDADELLAACTLIDSGNAKWAKDVLIALPGGGSVRMTYGYECLARLAANCRDFTDGWYADGWSEPADYNPADLTSAIVDPGPAMDALYVWGAGKSPMTNWLGDAISLRSWRSEAISVRIGAAV